MMRVHLAPACSKTLSFFSSHGQRVVLNASQWSVCSSHWRSLIIRRSLLNSTCVSSGYGWVDWHSGLYRLIGSCLMFCLIGVLLFWCSACLCSTCFMFCLIAVLLVCCSAWLLFYLFDVLLVLVFYLFCVLLDRCSACLMFYLTDVLLVWCPAWWVFYLSNVLLVWCSAY